MEWEVLAMVSLMIACVYLIRQLWMAEARSYSAYTDGMIAGLSAAERAAEMIEADEEQASVYEYTVQAVVEKIRHDELYKRGDLKKLRKCRTRNELDLQLNSILRRSSK